MYSVTGAEGCERPNATLAWLSFKTRLDDLPTTIMERKRPPSLDRTEGVTPAYCNKRSGGSGPAPESGGRYRLLRSADLPQEIAVSREEEPLDLGGPGARNPAAPGAYRELK
ncbi:hypothetical protein NDU88_007697 [Pleurodeles waltl]|uniref:Uncharacterized protein n=1 Tax=Pleurodeles waltl TaxID=8319 RepID=A0AAV7RSN1_PLEWA|nr:hypothetical protein NDU88_007697 [Pleurodeles waltl]